MKRALLIFLTVLFSCIVYSQDFIIPLKTNSTSNEPIIAKKSSTISTFTFSIDRLLGTNKHPEGYNQFTDLYFGKGYSEGEIGFPKLPAFKKLIQVPYGSKVALKVTSFSEKEISLSDYGIKSPLYPNQPSVSKSDDPQNAVFYFSEKAYAKPGYNHQDLAKVEILGNMRGVSIARIEVYPIRYDAVKGQIKVYNDIEIEVTTEAELLQKGDVNPRIKNFSPYFEAVYSSITSPFGKGVYDEHPDLVSYPVVMQIVTNRIFENTIKPFVDWKTKKGFLVNVAYTDVIGNTPQAIQSFVHGLYNNATEQNPAPTFLVLVGDVQHVPASGTGTKTYRNTDLYYASVDGDYFPDMYYGRLSADTPEQLSSIVEKIIYYEKYQFDKPKYLNNVTLIAGYDLSWNYRVGQPTVKYGTKNYFNTANGFNTIWGYGVDNDPNNPNNSPTYAGCYDSLRIAVGFINYTAHCSITEWGDPKLTVAQVKEMKNTNAYPLAIGNCCQSGDFGSSESIGEAWLRASKSGAVTYIGSAPNTYWYEDFYWAVGAFPIEGYNNGYVPSVDETTYGSFDAPFKSDYITAGGVVFVGNLAVTEAKLKQYPTHSSPEYYWQAYSVIGDPSLIPFFSEAEDNSVTIEESIPIGLNFIKVTALPNSYVGISKNGVLHGAGLIGSTGVANLPITPILEAGDVDIVITRPQTKPYIASVPTKTLSEAYITLNSFSISDIDENNNGLADFGETFTLNITLKNIGETSANNVIATVSGSDAYFKLQSSPSVNFGTITGTATSNVVSVNNAFTFTLEPNAPDKHKASFDLEISNGESIWTAKLYLTAHAPDLKIEDFEIVDNGNGNPGVLDPGETADIAISVSNMGTSDIQDVSAIFTPSNENIEVIGDNTKIISYIEAGKAVNVVFTVKANSSLPLETIVPVNLLVQTSGYNDNKNMNVMVGKIPDFNMGSVSIVTSCIGRFNDSGGPTGEYGDNEDYTITFLPAEEGKAVSIRFDLAFIEGSASEPYDKLFAYNSDTADPYTEFQGSPFIGSSGVEIGVITATNPKGALTFRFTSDLNTTKAGWVGHLSCVEAIYKATITVVNSKNERIPNATISIQGIETPLTSNSEGIAEINLPNGIYSFTATAPGYLAYTSEFQIAGAGTNVDIKLEPLYDATIIVNNSKNEKVSGATITIQGIQDAITTTSEGIAVFFLPNGTYSYTIKAEGYNEFTSDFKIDGANITVDIKLVLVSAHSELFSSISIYPNPFGPFIYFKGIKGIRQVDIYSVLGTLVSTYLFQGEEEFVLPTHTIPEGIYLIKLTDTSGETIVRRVNKQ